MAKSTPVQAAQDEKDIFQLTSAADFASQFPAEKKSEKKSEGLVSTVAKGGSAPSAKEEFTPPTGSEPGEASFSDWWNKDSTQEKFQGIMGSIGAIFGGMAGMPLGGGDMSSMERGAVRAAAAPGRARQMIQEKQFRRYIDAELASATDPHRRDMLMAVRANPAQAAQYLSMEGPGSKQSRAESLAELKHGYKMAEITEQNKGRGGITANRADDIGTASNMFYSLSEDDQRGLAEDGKIPREWYIYNPSAVAMIPHMYSPNGGVLAGDIDTVPFDLSGKVEVVDPETGDTVMIDLVERMQAWVADQWDSLTEMGRRWWDFQFKKYFMEHGGEGSEESKSVRERSGLE